jgi:hypothetical protein
MRPIVKKVLQEEVITSQDFAIQNNFSKSYIRSKCKNGTLEAVKIGNVWVIDKETIYKPKL